MHPEREGGTEVAEILVLDLSRFVHLLCEDR